MLLREENVCVSDRSASREWGAGHKAASLRDGVCRKLITGQLVYQGVFKTRRLAAGGRKNHI